MSCILDISFLATDALISVYIITDLFYIYRYASERDEGKNADKDGDVWEGSVLRNEPKEKRRRILYFSWCNDAAIFQSYRMLSFSPWVMECLNLPPNQRHSFSGLFFLALLPPNVRVLLFSTLFYISLSLSLTHAKSVCM
jgi:hypothetical protein